MTHFSALFEQRQPSSSGYEDGSKALHIHYKYKNEKGRWRDLKSKTALTFLRDFIDTVDEA